MEEIDENSTEEKQKTVVQIQYKLFRDFTQPFPLSLGEEISRTERNCLELNIMPLTYGEIEFMSMAEILNSAKLRGIPENAIFYDLGSGTGKAVLAASLLYNFQKCIGIEILYGLHLIALELQRVSYKSCPNITFLNHNIFDYDWSDADFIFINSTCFDSLMMMSIGDANVKPGTIGVSLSKEINHPSWVTLEKTKKQMSWGQAIVYIQRKINII